MIEDRGLTEAEIAEAILAGDRIVTCLHCGKVCRWEDDYLAITRYYFCKLACYQEWESTDAIGPSRYAYVDMEIGGPDD